MQDSKKLSENTLEMVKNSYNKELQEIREENRELEGNRETNLLALLEKEGQIKILHEKVIAYEREKKTQIDHADLLCKVVRINYIH